MLSYRKMPNVKEKLLNQIHRGSLIMQDYLKIKMSRLRFYSPRSPGVRHKSMLYFTELSKVKPAKALTRRRKASGGRNQQGVITSRGIGGVKRKYRTLEGVRRGFLRALSLARLPDINYPPPRHHEPRESSTKRDRNTNKSHELKNYTDSASLSAQVLTIELDPYRNSRIALVQFPDGRMEYILSPRTLKIGQRVAIDLHSPRSVGTTRPLSVLPVGCIIHNIELNEGQGGKIARAAGTFSQMLAKSGDFVTMKMPSGEVRLIAKSCNASLGQIGNNASIIITLGKAGRKRWLGKRPKVRGVAKNPVDHPHGGGEGRSPVGRKCPVTPWGKPALGSKTRNTRRKSTEYILRPRSK